jgi:aspartate racemase
LIGGLGVGATIYYYRELVKAHATRGCVPNLVIVHADLNRVLQYAATGDIAQMADYFLVLIRRLVAAGANVAAIPAITPHLCEPELNPRSPIPLVSLVDEIVDEVRHRKLRRVALMGTRFTVETELFGRLKAVDVVTPRTRAAGAKSNTRGFAGLRIRSSSGSASRPSFWPAVNCR